ncbi:16S rRNA (guanine(966)-N(2))-methyltransferase RsmD [Aliidiomarina taiwanensis]|uniref:Ribosomal RNA small subunit methyltransferase D n=1 Tax=Aliidiomarina taiwanensis TaxID=946228 RepID=A0A432X749_9GAMM|nr:16S rRNA (guanine(966)-N(2))-methyltransferase RsmD [Aliidiomarina taiwanensis]RUO42689.1 16S rRNA (guanine(966)-N(2))-methyltransferase RsmD [Aliidiomarina taiwanensis]
MARKNTAAQGHIRMIGGQWRGRKLPVTDAEGLRPTIDRLRETLFNWLQFELPQTQVLDVFAGTGSLGLEALSRGAAQATFFEQNRQACQQLRTNLTTLRAEQSAQIHQGNALQLLTLPNMQKPMQVVFLDPPFQQNLVNPAIELLEQHQWLAPDAWVYIETEHKAPVHVPAHWQLYREKTMGQSAALLYRVVKAPS